VGLTVFVTFLPLQRVYLFHQKLHIITCCGQLYPYLVGFHNADVYDKLETRLYGVIVIIEIPGIIQV
jgi:hypothetical protein